MAVWPAGICGHCPTQSSPVGQGHIDGKPLIFRSERFLQLGNRNAGLRRDGHITGGICNNLIERSQINADSRSSGRQAEIEHRPPAHGEDGQAVRRCLSHHFA